jgi:Domain of unknown function (DUF4253)
VRGCGWSGGGASLCGHQGEDVRLTARVPADGPVRLGAVHLPEGRQLPDGNVAAPLLWATSKPVPGAALVWQALSGMHHDTGLVPILLAFLVGGHQGRPWDAVELDSRCDLLAVDKLDAASVLAHQWAGSAPTRKEFEREPDFFADWFPPFGMEFPGLAPGQDQQLTSAELAAALGWFGPARIGLVPAARPADVLALVGFNGTVNGFGTPELLSAVLRSWEDRFGAVLIEVGFAHIRMLVRRPPRTRHDARAVAAELYVMCDEFWPPGKPAIAVYDVQQIAEQTLDIPIWSMWWD